MSSTPTEARRRLFFALWPEPALREALVRLSRRVVRGKGRAVAPDNLHITLAFLGWIEHERLPCLREAAGSVTAPRFELVLERLGYWPGPRVLWAAPAEIPAPLITLALGLQRALGACGWQPESRPFSPHLTLARKARHRPKVTMVEPVRWPVERFCLVESTTDPEGARYEVLDCWALGGGGAGVG